MWRTPRTSNPGACAASSRGVPQVIRSRSQETALALLAHDADADVHDERACLETLETFIAFVEEQN